MKYLLSLFLIMALTSCGNHTNKNANAPQDTVVVTAVANRAAKLDITLLPGTWVSVDDPKSTLIITKDYYILCYAGNDNDTSKYTVSHKSCADSDNNTDEYYIFLEEEEMCYGVEDVSKDNLSLVYLERGNMLEYRRVK
ncbi:MAG: hypothetical protein JST82_05110 [Bacteroidetes bacterium]|nr:hypothetical protein [Bacteroidota bacterium]